MDVMCKSYSSIRHVHIMIVHPILLSNTLIEHRHYIWYPINEVISTVVYYYNFNINTVDASGFEELLVRSRGTISQLINQSLNEKGQGNLI